MNKMRLEKMNTLKFNPNNKEEIENKIIDEQIKLRDKKNNDKRQSKK
jgi:hypothetical protein